ncbi:MAG: hypothetical protein ABI263_00695, partial [Gelidibacter sp.]
KVGGILENISDTKTGWLIEPYDVVAMAKFIINASGLTPSERARISEESIKRVKEYFDLELQKQAFHEFYTE